MRKRMLAAVVAAASCTTILTGTGGPAAAEGGDPGPAPTLAEILLSDGNQFDLNPFDYDIVTEAVLLFPELVAAASDPDAELTVFLPNDWAFRRLVADLTGLKPWREQAVFDAVAALGTDTVATVLQYHIVAGPPISFDGRQAVRWRRPHDPAGRHDHGRCRGSLVEEGPADRPRSRRHRSPRRSIPRSVAKRPTASPTASTASCDRSTSERPAATTSRAGRPGTPSHPRPARERRRRSPARSRRGCANSGTRRLHPRRRARPQSGDPEVDGPVPLCATLDLEATSRLATARRGCVREIGAEA